MAGGGEEPLISFTRCNTTPSPGQGPNTPTARCLLQYDSQWRHTPGGETGTDHILLQKSVFLMMEILSDYQGPRSQVNTLGYDDVAFDTQSAFYNTSR